MSGKHISLIVLILFLKSSLFSQSLPSIYGHTLTTIAGEKMSINKFAGKKILIVNTASYCSYTPQYAALQLLYANYNQYNFEIIGFPCNDFGGQDPGSDSTIKTFCSSNYNVTFPMMSKVKIALGDTAPIYKWLQRANLNGKMNTSVAWNFGKFLINETGQLVKYYPSIQNPADTAITNWILSKSSAVGLSENKKDEFVKLVSYRNVSKKAEFEFSSPEWAQQSAIKIFSIDGRLMPERLEKENVGDARVFVDLNNLAPGVYFLRISNANSEVIMKLPVGY